MSAMIWPLASALSVLVFAAACERTRNASATDSPRSESAERAGARNVEGHAERRRRDAALKAAAAEFQLAPDAEARRTTYATLLSCLGEAPELAQTPEYARFRNSEVEALLAKLKTLQEEARANEDALNAAPVKPVYEPPKYTGAYYLSGSVKRCYADGVAIESGSKYYFLKNEPCPQFASVLHGYVEDTFDTVTLDLGRSGREAVVVNIRDKETADDDRVRFRAEVAEYKKEYNERLAEFRAVTKARQGLVSQLQSRVKVNDAARATATARLDRLLLALGKGQPLDAVHIDELPVQSAAAMSEKSAAVAKVRDSARQNAQQGTAKSSKRSAMSCMKGCIASCGGDAACERRCVAQDCP